jgi:hypothetical protein
MRGGHYLAGLAASLVATFGLADPGRALTKADRLQWRQDLPLEDVCRAYAEPESALDAPALEIHPLGPESDLLVVPCTLGPYQGAQRFFVLPRGAPRRSAQPLALPVYDEKPPKGRRQKRMAEEVSGEARFDDVDRVLTVFFRARSPGDCGWWAAYRFEGTEPKPREFRVRECTEALARKPPPPQKWKNVLPRK